jgi:hypothetical protein
MNEQYYNRLNWLGWDLYNCPPAWYYLDQESMKNGILRFADYEEMKLIGKDPEQFARKFLNVTEQIYENAGIIHYLGDTKPWSSTRESAKVFEIFDRAFLETEAAYQAMVSGV